MKKAKYIIYTVICLLILCIPSAGLLLSWQNTEPGNEKKSAMPKLVKEDGKIDLLYLQNLGNYFQQNFAFRSNFVTTNARILSGIGVSADDGVIDGTDGWLYYSDSLDDYLKQNLLSDRAIYNIAHTMAMTQEYVETQGVRFLYVPVPNKNTLYGEQMPYYYGYKADEDEVGNLQRLYVLLEEEGINAVNLLKKFEQQEKVLYHRTDSHWTNEGAALAAGEILEAVGREHYDYEQEPYEIRNDFVGDLEEMLYPADLRSEEEVYYAKEANFTYDEEVSSNFYPKIDTTNPEADGSLVMYRDSFGNALLPFIAENFGKAYFSRAVPYYLSDIIVHQADTLIIERAERFLPDTVKNPPVFAGKILLSLPGDAELALEAYPRTNMGQETELHISSMGTLLQLDGVLDPTQCTEKSRIYVELDGLYYEAMPICVELDGTWYDYGFRLYVNGEPEENDGTEHSVRVFVTKDI